MRYTILAWIAATCLRITGAAHLLLRRMRIIIFTGHEFDGEREIQRIAEHHSVLPISESEITFRSIFDFTTHRYADVLHFAMHSGPDGIELPDGTILSPEDIARMAKTCRAQIVVLNSCENSRPSIVIAFKNIPFVFYGTGKPDHQTAINFSTTFYAALPEKLTSPLQVLEAYADFAYDGEGNFGYVISPTYLRNLLKIAPRIYLPTWQWLVIAAFGVASMALSIIAMLR